MNRGIEDRLERIVRFENAKKEKALRAEQKRQEERARKLRGDPFKLSTSNRRHNSSVKLMNFYRDQDSTFDKPMSNLAYERMRYGQQALTLDGGKHGLLSNAKMEHIRTTEKLNCKNKITHPKPFFLYSQESGKKALKKSLSTLTSSLPTNRIPSQEETLRSVSKDTPSDWRYFTAQSRELENNVPPMARIGKENQTFRNTREQEAHVNKMYYNTGGCTRKDSCESCRKGERKHVWPDSKKSSVLRLSKIKPLAPSSRLIKMLSQNYFAPQPAQKVEDASSGSRGFGPGNGSTRNCAQFST